MILSPGQRLGPYEILSPIGAGGMGEVYKARDTRLERFVAIKVLPAELAANPDRLRRFEQESRAASALNHPNIVTVYDVGSENSISYMAIEFIDGRTLAEAIAAGPMSVRKLLEVAAQIADGIATAHDAGIVHRDLKPGNLMITREGFVKVLDFGLARREPTVGSDPAATTATSPMTFPGAVVGTVGYMSPEQARGAAVDYRSDQFSFGSVLYEMVTGRRAFRRDDAIDTLSAILHDEPEPITKLRPDLPPPVRWIVERCLAKAPSERYNSTRDLARELQGLRDHFSELSGEERAGKSRSMRRWRPAAIAIAFGAVIAAAGVWLGISAAVRQSAVPEFRRLTFRSGLVEKALFVPRSNAILYTASWDAQPASSFVTLPESKGIDRKLEGPVQLPMAYSEDGSEVLVILGRSRPSLNGFGTLAWWPALGGRPRPVLENAGWADWAPRGHFLAVVRVEGADRILEIRDSDGKNSRALFRTAGAISWVRISPDEKQVAFVHHASRFDDSGQVRVVGVNGSGSRAVSPVFETCLGLAWNEKRGEIWFTATRESIYSTSLWAADPRGTARRLYSFPDLLTLNDLSDRQCLLIGESGDTRLLLRRGDLPPTELSWLGTAFVTDISHDGKSVLFIDGTAEDKTLGTWVRSLDGGEAVKVAEGEPASFSPDGLSVVTTTRTDRGPAQLVLVSTKTGEARQLTDSTAIHTLPTFLGADAVLFGRTENGRNEIWRMPIRGGQERRVAVGCDRPAADPVGASFLCTGGLQDNVLYVGPLTNVPKDAPLRSVLALEGGVKFLYARWNTDGQTIYAVTSDRRFLNLDVRTGAALRDEPIPLPASLTADAVLGAALSGDASVQAYSVSHLSSLLYLFRGL